MIEAIDHLTEGWLSDAEDVLQNVWQFDSLIDSMSATTKPLHLNPQALGSGWVFNRRSESQEPGVRAAGSRTHLNVMVTNGELVPTLVKLMVFGLHKYFHPSCIMSSREVGKLACFSEVVRRFGFAEEIVAIGDSSEERDAAAQCNFRFVNVETPQDIKSVQNFLM
mmetsp:Transcript_2046/g.3272  ORF Transcript_2046/g.3272 Transcript_2046/m.3272 type:complete len:166 (+) Transcript_2046:171-668(+)